MIGLDIPGEPFAQPRARAAVVNGRARIYDPKAAKNWKSTAQAHMGMALRVNDLPVPLFASGPVNLSVRAYFTMPKGMHRKTTRTPARLKITKPDLDNILKAVKDAAKGVLWLDDNQVAVITAEKWYAPQGGAPRVEVRVSQDF